MLHAMRVLPLLLLLAACGNTPTGDLLRAGLAPPPSRLPPEGAEALPPEPALSVTINGRRTIATLIQSNGEQRMWRSPNGLVVQTDGARVVATAGTRTWLAATRIDGPDPLDDPTALADQPAVMHRSVDLMRSDRSPDHMRFGVPVECRLRGVRQPDALLIEERCGGGASFTNLYWAEPETGSIWRSQQWVGGDAPAVIEVITPPAS
ncbi:YjbF family lipoprotein [Roseomonas elaeocarpi]|uniref:YjbF family lipoprotein n=1 Tax=Roseomonas elaeocarpi TaxID=907779 RepID=A0ABV6JRK0_9PROT